MKIMPRKLQALGKDAPSVESSLDNFIARANDDLVDVSDFDPTKAAQRELALKHEVDDLKQRLAKVQTRGKPSQGWGKLVIGYVLGCASIFAVSALIPKDSPPQPSQAAVTTPSPVQATAPTPPPPAPSVTPIEPAPAPAPVAAPVATPPAPAPTPIAATPEAPAPKTTKKARRPAPAPQPQAAPPPAQVGSGSDTLFNPF
jgi:cell division protein FtsN